jgi:membrane-associated phospholipid phosphatase
MKKNEIASLVSHLFSPPGVALVLFIWLASEVGGGDGGWQATAIGLGGYVLVPCLVMLALKNLGYLRDLYDPEPAHRQRILAAGLACYLMGYSALLALGAHSLFLWCSACFSAGAAIVWLINYFWKISIHATGLGGGLFILLEVSGQWVLPGGAVVALAVAWSRLRLGAHTEPQLFAGFGLGVILGWALFPFHHP